MLGCLISSVKDIIYFFEDFYALDSHDTTMTLIQKSEKLDLILLLSP